MSVAGEYAPLRPARFTVFDLEMDALLPSAEEWPPDGSCPVRLLCAATVRLPLTLPLAAVAPQQLAMEARVWAHPAAAPVAAASAQQHQEHQPPRRPLPPMRPEDVRGLLDYLTAAAADGDVLVTWGGTSGDWRLLASQCGDAAYAARARALARAHVDVPLAAVSNMGAMVGLRAACLGMGLGAKHPLASASVPSQWAAGAAAAVLRHVYDDAVATAYVYSLMFADGPPQLAWQTVRGAIKHWRAPAVIMDAAARTARLHTVAECLTAAPLALPYELPSYMQPAVLAAWLAAADDGAGTTVR